MIRDLKLSYVPQGVVDPGRSVSFGFEMEGFSTVDLRKPHAPKFTSDSLYFSGANVAMLDTVPQFTGTQL